MPRELKFSILLVSTLLQWLHQKCVSKVQLSGLEIVYYREVGQASNMQSVRGRYIVTLFLNHL